MTQSPLDRIWDRLTARYEQDEDSDCCGAAVKEVQSASGEAEAENYCE